MQDTADNPFLHLTVLSSEQLKLCKESPWWAKQSRDVITALACSSLSALGWHPGKAQSQGAVCTVHLAWDCALLFPSPVEQGETKGQCLFLVFPTSHNSRRGFSSTLAAERAAVPLLALAVLPSTSILHLLMLKVSSPSGRAAGSKEAAGRLVRHVEGGVGEESKSGRGDKERWDGNGRKAAGMRGESGKWIEMS